MSLPLRPSGATRTWGSLPVQAGVCAWRWTRSEEHTSELQSRLHLVCRLQLEKKKGTPGYMSPEQAWRKRVVYRTGLQRTGRSPLFPYTTLFRSAVGDDAFRIPYWDWTADTGLNEPATSPIWSNANLGQFAGSSWRVRLEMDQIGRAHV